MRTPTGLIRHPFVTGFVTEPGGADGQGSVNCCQDRNLPGWRNGKRRGLKIPRGQPLVSSILTPGIQ